MRRLFHWLFGWHDWVWMAPQDTYDTCTICGAKERRHNAQ